MAPEQHKITEIERMRRCIIVTQSFNKAYAFKHVDLESILTSRLVYVHCGIILTIYVMRKDSG